MFWWQSGYQAEDGVIKVLLNIAAHSSMILKESKDYTVAV